MLHHHCANIVAIMKRGGYYDRIMSSGPELNRVKLYLRALDGEIQLDSDNPLQRPTYPCFPGLRHKNFHDKNDFPGVKILEDSFDDIYKDVENLNNSNYYNYEPIPDLNKAWTTSRPDIQESKWSLYLLNYVGENLDIDNRCSNTRKLIATIPDVCLEYPWGEALFSNHLAGMHLPSHCSIDNLRVRIHLGIRIPDSSVIRVGKEVREWEVGKCLVFEDSIEHEVWNNSQEDRLVLIVDCWHPDLTYVEIDAITAGFRKSEVRRSFFRERISSTSAPKSYINYLDNLFDKNDADILIKKFWKS